MDNQHLSLPGDDVGCREGRDGGSSSGVGAADGGLVDATPGWRWLDAPTWGSGELCADDLITSEALPPAGDPASGGAAALAAAGDATASDGGDRPAGSDDGANPLFARAPWAGGGGLADADAYLSALRHATSQLSSVRAALDDVRLAIRSAASAREAAAAAAAAPSDAADASEAEAAAQQLPGLDVVWGWLRPLDGCALPPVLLRGGGVVVGRGGAAAARHPGGLQGAVCVHDGRVSRVHCRIGLSRIGLSAEGGPRFAVQLEDLSSGGTWLNGARVAPGAAQQLKPGDVVALVLSVVPLRRVGWTVCDGDPRQEEADAAADPAAADELTSYWADADAGVYSPAKSRLAAAVASAATAKYTSLLEATADDLACAICLDTMRDPVAFEPCGHSFCSSCASRFLEATLTALKPVACPLRRARAPIAAAAFSPPLCTRRRWRRSAYSQRQTCTARCGRSPTETARR